MFDAPQLNDFLSKAYTVRSQPRIIAEINMNSADNIERIGCYRLRPRGMEARYRALPAAYDPFDQGDHYIDSELSYAEIGGTYESGVDDASQIIFRQEDQINTLYSLEDCFRHNRPRSGINKLLYLGSGGRSRPFPQFIDGTSDNPALRPRHYVATKDDYFKYWTSYKREGSSEFGISRAGGKIDDAVPFVVYKNPVPANRIVVKMQTGVGEENRGKIMHNGTYIDDPLFGQPRVPLDWSIEVLQNGSWFNAHTFVGSTQIAPDGHVSISYGIVAPSNYRNKFLYKGELTSESLLPHDPRVGDLYLVKTAERDIGLFYIAVEVSGDIAWDTFEPEYGWLPTTDETNNQSAFLTNIVNPDAYGTPLKFREFEMIEGLRIVVRTMRHADATFDLIELSPRLAMDWTDRTASFNVNKSMADLSGSSVPVGNLMASTGSIAVSNTDSAFNVNNGLDVETGIGSVVAEWPHRVKIQFFDKIIDANGYDYFVPIKTLYTESSPGIRNEMSDIQMDLRDLYFLFESMQAPSLIMTDVSLSRAIMTIMDFIGFTNYAFKRLPGQTDPIIPYFFIPPEKTVADIMVELAVATQSAMYLDEFNNLIIASKEYILPEPGQRPVDFVARGDDDGKLLANINAISSAERQVFNSGEITYTKRYIQRTYGSLQTALNHPRDKAWIYSPALVWEVTGESQTKPMNDVASESEYTLTALPLSKPLSADIPAVLGGQITNNTLDVGDAADYVARYNGYLFANGEIIRYDAVEFAVTGSGNVWVTSPDEYQNYFLGLPFNGRIYPTGRIRIWAEPYYKSNPDGSATLQIGAVKHHGRGQFGTEITSHSSAVPEEWTSNLNVKGIAQNADPLFNMREEQNYSPSIRQNTASGGNLNGKSSDMYARASSRGGIIKNHLSRTMYTDAEIGKMHTALPGTLQSSAFVFAGPSYPADVNPRNHVSYVHKSLDKHYTNFGTRCRIIGKVEAGSSIEQNAIGSSTYFSIPSKTPESQTHISGGSGGIAVNVDPNTNAGYFFEIAALTSADPSSYDVPETEFASDAGRITNINIQNDIVTVTVDGSAVKLPVSIESGEMISISGFYGGGEEVTFPSIDGPHLVDSVTDTTITFAIKSNPYTWYGSFGNVFNESGTSLGPIRSASIAEDGMATFVFVYPTGVFVGEKILASGFEGPSGIPDINKSNIDVVTVSSDGRTITAKVPKFTGSMVPENEVKIEKLNYEKPVLSNIWFYKTVADDMGGDIVSFSRDSLGTTLVVANHQLNVGNIVKVSIPGNPYDMNRAYSVVGITGTTVRLDMGGYAVPSQSTMGRVGLYHPIATTYKLWSGLSNILVDSGQFWAHARSVAEENTTVYDLNIETIDTTYGRTFYLYINNRQVATVTDTNPLVKVNNMALFIRGQSKLMFENVYALGENIANASIAKQVQPGRISEVFGIPDGINESEALRKYAVSGFVQSSFLSGIRSKSNPEYNMYYEEFGTIMREAAYFNVKYDKAFPALYARIAPVLNRIKGYTVSGFMAGAYGAEFMIFNNLDTLCSLDPTTGNYLRINGVVFTQSTTKTLTVDDYMSDVDKIGDGRFVIKDPTVKDEMFDTIKKSRIRYGRNEFSIASDYIQNDDTANNIMEWVINKVSRPRKNVGLDIFQTPTVQLGDICQIKYVDSDDNEIIASEDQQFVVYNIEYSKSAGESSMQIYVTEV